jgi:hypothetical protein
MGNGEQKLGWFCAVINAFLNRRVSHYPRFKNDRDEIELISDPAIIEQIAKAIENLSSTPDELASYLDRGRETLDEVKGLTEYQDQKATRLLTIITFLSALSGALYSRFVDSYPLPAMVTRYGLNSLKGVLVGATHVSFGLFAISVICGAMVIFHATRTRFKYPELDAEAPGHRRSRPGSYLFYSDIIELRPARWAASFTANQAGSTLDSELPLQYLKNYIAESYLVAAKVADKLRYLKPAQDILAFSIRVLLIWLIFLGVTAAVVPGYEKTNLPVAVLAPDAPITSPEPLAKRDAQTLR